MIYLPSWRVADTFVFLCAKKTKAVYNRAINKIRKEHHMLKVGERVFYKNSDTRMQGTIVFKRRGSKLIMVKWDHGDTSEHSSWVIQKMES